MAWITRLSYSDYSIGQATMALMVIRDSRNQRAYQLYAHQIEKVIKRANDSTLFLPDERLWIKGAVDEGFIPHPYDEFE